MLDYNFKEKREYKGIYDKLSFMLKGNKMNYYFWIKGYESVGVVKADTIEEAQHKVIMSQGACINIYLLDNEEYDGYDVAVLIIE